MTQTPDVAAEAGADGLLAGRQPAAGKAGGIYVFLAKFFSREALLQGINFLCGIFVIRTLSVHEYAWYTIAVTLVGAGSVLCDIGVGAALMSVAGRLWPDRAKINSVFAVAFQTRTRFFIVFGLVIFAAGLLLLSRSQSTWTTSLIIMTIVVLITFFQLNFDLMAVLPKLEQNLGALQKMTISGALLRLVVLSLILVSPHAATALLAALAAMIFQAYRVRRLYGLQDKDEGVAVAEVRQEFSRVARRQAPASIYFCIQGQLNVFLLGYFGSAVQVAQLGALGRISALLVVAQSVFSNILMPRFSVLKEKAEMRRMYLLFVSLFLVIIALFLGTALLFPTAILSILGGKYSGLNTELLLILGSASLYVIEGLLYSLNMSRAWIAPSWIQVVVTLGCQAILLCFMSIDSISRVVIFSSISPVVSITVYVILAVMHFGRMK
ncbi:O-antigen/teichoic acid export membrane protein [Paraburkholderia sp. GAS199]|uniref:lipopolysaccharide biosynthesis protein n=1 Tax=Paraburkholderia sp. GAS199 TaxID=3035126 RepID=UPI003D1DD066